MLYNLWGGKAIFPFSKIKAVFVGLPTSKTTPVFHNSSNPLPVAGWPHLELFWEIFPLPQDTWNHVEQLRLSAVIPLLSVCILPFFLRTSSLRERQNKRVILLSLGQLCSSDASSRTVGCFLWKEITGPWFLRSFQILSVFQLTSSFSGNVCKRHTNNGSLFITNESCNRRTGLLPQDLGEQCTNFRAKRTDF